jgi:hypothetical protein
LCGLGRTKEKATGAALPSFSSVQVLQYRYEPVFSDLLPLKQNFCLAVLSQLKITWSFIPSTKEGQREEAR